MAADPAGDPTTLFSVRGKVALVTGGSRGIGYMIAHGFLAAGAKVYVSARKAEACEQAATQLGDLGTCIAVPADVASADGLESLARSIEQREGALHVLVNNAGATWGAPLEEYPEAAFDKLLDVNVKAVFALTVRLLPLLRAAARADDPARVINVGSVDGLSVPVQETYAYSASKAAVHMLTRHLAMRLAAERITVNAMAPGPFDSKMMSFLLDDPESREMIAQHVPLGRIGRPDDVAGLAIFLASRAGAYLTGTVIPVDGGLSARARS